MIRALAIVSLALCPVLAAAQSYTGGVRAGFGCPSSPRCADLVTVDVRPGSLAGQRGAVFVGFVPVIQGQLSLPGGFIGPQGNVVIGPSPVPYAVGPLAATSIRASIPGGICGAAAKQGGVDQIALVAGVGLADARFAEAGAVLEDLLASAQNAEERQMIEESIAQASSGGGEGASAAQEMISAQRFTTLTVINCTSSEP